MDSARETGRQGEEGGMKRGVFITFEGNEGCGKSTQIQRLARRLERAGLRVVVTREPGGTPVGEEIRHLLQFSSAGHAMKPETELLLFAASRAQLVRELIAPALDEGATVIADRFLDSTTVYQGVARKLEPAAVKFVNAFAAGGCTPDITFVLDIDPARARERMMRRPRPVGAEDRMEKQPAEFYEHVRAGYLKLAASEPERIRLIDGSKGADEVEEEIWREVAARLNAETA
jgi:dTMP kinase